jgi:hypothetical protein
MVLLRTVSVMPTEKMQSPLQRVENCTETGGQCYELRQLFVTILSKFVGDCLENRLFCASIAVFLICKSPILCPFSRQNILRFLTLSPCPDLSQGPRPRPSSGRPDQPSPGSRGLVDGAHHEAPDALLGTVSSAPAQLDPGVDFVK